MDVMNLRVFVKHPLLLFVLAALSDLRLSLKGLRVVFAHTIPAFYIRFSYVISPNVQTHLPLNYDGRFILFCLYILISALFFCVYLSAELEPWHGMQFIGVPPYGYKHQYIRN